MDIPHRLGLLSLSISIYPTQNPFVSHTGAHDNDGLRLHVVNLQPNFSEIMDCLLLLQEYRN